MRRRENDGGETRKVQENGRERRERTDKGRERQKMNDTEKRKGNSEKGMSEDQRVDKFTHDCVVRFGGAAGLPSSRVGKHVGSPAKEARSCPGPHRADVPSTPSAFTCTHGRRASGHGGASVGYGEDGRWVAGGRSRDEALLGTDNAGRKGLGMRRDHFVVAQR